MTKSPYEKLPPTADYARIHYILRECLKTMNADGRTYAVIAKDFLDRGYNVSEAALRTFVSRDYVKKPNADNKTFPQIYNFLSEIDRIQSERAKAVILQEWNVFKGLSADNFTIDQPKMPTFFHSFVSLFYNWFRIETKDLIKISAKIDNEYIVLRKSVRDENIIVKSSLTIKINPKKRNYISAQHTHFDRHNRPRESSGFLVYINPNIHIYLQIENGAGIESINLKDPIQARPKRMHGFMETMDTDRKLVSARVLVEPKSEFWDTFKSRFQTNELDKDLQLKKEILELLDSNTAHQLPVPVVEF